MIITTFKYKDDEYNLRLTNEAKRRLEELQKEKLEKVGTGEFMSLTAKQQRLLNELDKLTNRAELDEQTNETKIDKIQAQLDELTAEIAPYMFDLMNVMDGTDYESIPWILINSDHNYKNIVKKEDFEEMLLSLEDEKGFAKYNEWLITIAEKVFMAIGEVKKLKEEKLDKAEENAMPIPAMMN